MIHEDVIDHRVLSRRILRAKKDHTCTRCKKPILKGYVYLKEAALYDGKFICDKLHPGRSYCWEDPK